MPSSTIWISLDLGVRGDYESLYRWLDERDAKDCVNGLALLTYSYQGDLVKTLRKELEGNINIDKRVRMYVIYRESATKKMKGVFLFGGRRAPVWAGFSQRESTEEDEF